VASSSSWAYPSSELAAAASSSAPAGYPPVYGGHKRSHARDIGAN
jgi:hypothetical protein